MTVTSHGQESASAWIQRWSHLVAPGGSVLDVACGRGRHLRWFAGRGHAVTGVDRVLDIDTSLADLVGAGRVRMVKADIEGNSWPLMDGALPQTFDAVVVTNYLWRPLLPTLVGSLVPGGVLLYETFAHGNASVGKPSRPDFLLAPGELLRAFSGLHTVAFEDGFCADPDRFVQRIAAVRPVTSPSGSDVEAPAPPRYPLG